MCNAVGEDQDAGDLFMDEEPSGMTKRELYKQNKEAQTMERLTRRMQGESILFRHSSIEH